MHSDDLEGLDDLGGKLMKEGIYIYIYVYTHTHTHIYIHIQLIWLPRWLSDKKKIHLPMQEMQETWV